MTGAVNDNVGNAIQLLTQVLNSEQMRVVSNSINEMRQPAARPVDTELQRLFNLEGRTVGNPSAPPNVMHHRPRYETRQYFSGWAARPRKRCSQPLHATFIKDLVLVPRPSWETVCRHRTRARLHDSGHIVNGFEIKKAWSKTEVVREVRQAFKDKIPEDVSIEFLMPCGKKLVPPKLQEGQELSGFIIHKVFRSKSLYIRPSRSLLFESSDSEGDCAEEDSSATDQRIDSQQVFPNRMTTRARTSVATVTQASSNWDEIRVVNETSAAEEAFSDEVMIVNSSTVSEPRSDQFNPVSAVNRTSADAYEAYLAILPSSVEVSSDDELQEAILASLESQISTADCSRDLSAQDLLKELSLQVDYTRRCKFNINRSNVLDGAMRGFKRASYQPTHSISVKFSDDTGQSEEAVDLGGPRREFFRLLMEVLAQSPMFEGREDQQNLALDSSALREDKYFVAGCGISVSLVHGGPAPGFLSQTLVSCLVKGPDSANPVMEDIADADLYEKVKRVSECETLSDLIAATEPLTDYLANAGCLRPLRCAEDRHQLVKDILMFQVIHRVRGAFERFRDGLKTLGVLDMIQKHPQIFRPLLCHSPVPLTADCMEEIFHIRLSEKGSNRRVAEEIVVPFWRDYLQDAEEEGGPVKLSKLLAFATGANTIPPIGFSPQPSIDFLHHESKAQRPKHTFPTANTCINCLKLPLCNTYDAFKYAMDFALGNTQGFGRA